MSDRDLIAEARETAYAALSVRLCATDGCGREAGFYWHDAGPFGAGTTWGCSQHVPADDLGDVWPIDAHERDQHGVCMRCRDCSDPGCCPPRECEGPAARAEHQFDPGGGGPEWARWPWQTCVARTLDVYGSCRCDLKRGHRGPHRAERGMYDVCWPENTWTVSR